MRRYKDSIANRDRRDQACSYLQDFPRGAAARDARRQANEGMNQPSWRRCGKTLVSKRWGAGPEPTSRQVAPAHRLPAASGELGGPETRGLLFGRVAVQRTRRKPRSGRSRWSTTNVSVGDRLVDFSEFKITESIFPRFNRTRLDPAERNHSCDSAQPARANLHSADAGQYRHERDHRRTSKA